jgi:HEAT repeat protein
MGRTPVRYTRLAITGLICVAALHGAPLGAQGQPTTIAGWVEVLGSDLSSMRRVAAAKALGELGDSAKAAVPALLRALSDPYSYVRGAAARSLARLAPTQEAVVQAVQGLLADPDLGVRSEGARALGEMGPHARASVPALIEALETDDYYGVRRHSAHSLGRIAPGDTSLIAPLARAITGATRTAAFDSIYQNARYYFHVQSQATAALLAMGDAGVTAVVDLFASGAARVVVEQLAEAKDRLGPHLPHLVGLLETAEPDVIEPLSWLLAEIGEPVLPMLRPLLEHPDATVRQRAERAVRRIEARD